MSGWPRVRQIRDLEIFIVDAVRTQDEVTFWDKREGKGVVVFGDGGVPRFSSIICVKEREFPSIQNMTVTRCQNIAAYCMQLGKGNFEILAPKFLSGSHRDRDSVFTARSAVAVERQRVDGPCADTRTRVSDFVVHALQAK